MIKKIKEKEQAIILRKKGLSYNDILRLVPVAKSTLSVWLREIKLAKRQEQKFTERRRAAQQKAQETWRQKRIQSETEIKRCARLEIGRLSKRERWFIGVALYWAEGSKQKPWHVSQRVSFGNSDPKMVKTFLRWLDEFCGILLKDISVRLYIHKSGNEKLALKHWSEYLEIPIDKFSKTVFKKNKVKTNRRFNAQYNGLVRLDVKRSTNLNRKISGWIEGLV